MVREFKCLKDPVKFENPLKMNCVAMKVELTASYSRSIDVKVMIQAGETSVVTLEKVLFVPALTFNLFSATRITLKGILGTDQQAEYANVYLLEMGENVFSENLVDSTSYL